VSGTHRGSPGGEKSSPGIPPTNLAQGIYETILKDPETGEKSIDHDLGNYYLDCLAKVEKSVPKSCLPFASEKCGQWAKVGWCEKGHRFAVQIFCRKPYCPICHDIVHQQTIHRIYPKAQQVLYGAWWVIPPPPDTQVLFHNRCGRRRFISKVIKALKSLGYRRGIVFVHLFGDDPTKFFFHVNVVVDGGWLEPEVLADLQRKLRRLIYPRSIIRKWGDKLDIFYEYKKNEAMAYQALDYFSRPTFTQLEGNEWLADSIKGEHLIRTWGRWDEEPKWHLDETDKKVKSLVSVEKGKCPIDGTPIHWAKPVIPSALIDFESGVELAPGYHILPKVRPPPGGPVSPPNLTELPDGDPRKLSNLVKRHGERAADILSQLDDDESHS